MLKSDYFDLATFQPSGVLSSRPCITSLFVHRARSICDAISLQRHHIKTLKKSELSPMYVWTTASFVTQKNFDPSPTAIYMYLYIQDGPKSRYQLDGSLR